MQDLLFVISIVNYIVYMPTSSLSRTTLPLLHCAKCYLTENAARIEHGSTWRPGLGE